MPGYVIITPAHNEAELIGRTVESMAAQTIPPLKWVVVNDASTDRTREVMQTYVERFPFIELVNLERASGRHFGNKVRAFNAGLERVQGLDFDFVGNLDADISFGPVYFENILQQFRIDPKLGIGGGMVHTTINGEFVSQEVALDSVAGAVQLFRRKCFEQVGGYKPLPNGGIDAAAEITARMHGWNTRTFAEFPVQENRMTGSVSSQPLMFRVKEGRRMHSLGYSPLFFFVRCLRRLMEKPAVIGSGAALYGYFSSVFGGNPRAVDPEVVSFLRKEQHGKLKRLLRLRTA